VRVVDYPHVFYFRFHILPDLQGGDSFYYSCVGVDSVRSRYAKFSTLDILCPYFQP
jgi:hypothetical protein